MSDQWTPTTLDGMRTIDLPRYLWAHHEVRKQGVEIGEEFDACVAALWVTTKAIDHAFDNTSLSRAIMTRVGDRMEHIPISIYRGVFEHLSMKLQCEGLSGGQLDEAIHAELPVALYWEVHGSQH